MGIIEIKMQKKLFSKSKAVQNLMVECDTKESLISFEGGQKAEKESSPIMACLCPAKKAPAEFKEAQSLRRMWVVLFLLEIVYIFLDLFFYSSFYLAIFELPRLWMCYYNYVTLSRCMMNVFMFYIVVGGVGSVFSFLTIGMSGLINMIIFPVQLALMVLTGYILWFKIGAYVKAKKEFE